MTLSEFVTSTNDGHVGTLELHRPRVNALNHALEVELIAALDVLEANDVQVAILTGGDLPADSCTKPLGVTAMKHSA